MAGEWASSVREAKEANPSQISVTWEGMPRVIGEVVTPGGDREVVDSLADPDSTARWQFLIGV